MLMEPRVAGDGWRPVCLFLRLISDLVLCDEKTCFWDVADVADPLCLSTDSLVIAHVSWCPVRWAFQVLT